MKKVKLYVFVMLLMGIAGIWQQSSNCQAVIYKDDFWDDLWPEYEVDVSAIYHDDQGVKYSYHTGEDSEGDSKYLYKGMTVSGFEQRYDASGKPMVTQIVIPDSIEGKPIIGIESGVLKKHPEITSVVWGSGMEWIDNWAFMGCTGLQKITFNEGLEWIGESAFEGCASLKEISIPGSVETIKKEAFASCKNLSNVKFIGVPDLKKNVFQNSKILNEATYTNGLFIVDRILIDGSKAKGKINLDGRRVMAIAAEAFQNNQNLTSISCKGLWIIGDNAFRGKKKLKFIRISETESIGTGSFWGCNAKKIELKNVNFIGKDAFFRCKVNTVALRNIGTIGSWAYGACSAKKIVLKQVKKMKRKAFGSCKQLKTVSISGVKTIGTSAFEDCKRLEKVFLGKATQTLGECCFNYCTKLKKVVIYSKNRLNWKKEEEVWKQDRVVIKPFYACDNLKHVYLKSSKVSKSIKEVFEKEVTLHVPEGKEKAYRKYVECKVV